MFKFIRFFTDIYNNEYSYVLYYIECLVNDIISINIYHTSLPYSEHNYGIDKNKREAR